MGMLVAREPGPGPSGEWTSGCQGMYAGLPEADDLLAGKEGRGSRI